MATLLADYASATTQTLTRSITVTAGQYVVLYAGNTGSVAQSAASSGDTSDHAKLVLTKLQESAGNGSARGIAVAYGGFALTSGTLNVTVTFASSAPADGFSFVYAYDDIDVTDPVYGEVNNFGTGDTSLTLSATPDAADEVCALYSMRNKVADPTSINNGMSKVKSGYHATPVAGAILIHATGKTDTAIGMTGQGSVWNAAIGFVLRAAADDPDDPPSDATYVWDGSDLVAADPYYWNGSTLEAVDAYHWDGSVLA